MRYFSRNKDVPDIEAFEEHIRYLGYVYMDLEEVEFRIDEVSKSILTKKRWILDYMRDKNSQNYVSMSTANFIDYMTKHENVSIDSFKSRKNKSGVSIDMTKILTPIYERGLAKFFLENYFEIQSAGSLVSNARGLIERNKNNEKITTDGGKVLTKIPFNVHQEVNLRYNYSNEALQNINRKLTDTIGVPEGYVMLSADLKQSDFRTGINLILWSDEIKQIMQQHPEDVYEGVLHLVHNQKVKDLKTEINKLEVTVKEEMIKYGDSASRDYLKVLKEQLKELSLDGEIPRFKSKEERLPYKIDGLQGLFGNTKTRNPERSKFLQELSKVFMAIPKYKEIYERANIWKEFCPYALVSSYFGHEEIVPIDNAHTGGYKRDELFQIFNYPNQTGTSELLILIATGIMEEIKSLGYSKDDVICYLEKHDELIFIVKEHILPNVAYIFENYKTIQIDDWFPVGTDDWKATYFYNVPDQRLQEIYDNAVKNDIDKIDFFPPTEPIPRDILPSTRMYGFTCTFLSEEKAIACLLDNTTNEPYILSVNLKQNRDRKEVVKAILTKLITERRKFFKLIAVVTNEVDAIFTEDVEDNSIVSVKFSNKYSSLYYDAVTILRNHVRHNENL